MAGNKENIKYRKNKTVKQLDMFIASNN